MYANVKDVNIDNVFSLSVFEHMFPLYTQLTFTQYSNELQSCLIYYKVKVLTDCHLSNELLQVVHSDCSLHLWCIYSSSFILLSLLLLLLSVCLGSWREGGGDVY